MPPNTISIRIKRKKPSNHHTIHQNGKLVYDNHIQEDKRITLSVKYVVRSEYWWSEQRVTDNQGKVWETDVFQYGDYYVILMTNGDKIQVVHDGGINWHIA